MKTKNNAVRKSAAQKRSDELSVIIRTAALTIDPKGSIDVLAKRCHISKDSIYKSIKRGAFSVGHASSIEIALGREVIKRELLCPDLK